MCDRDSRRGADREAARDRRPPHDAREPARVRGRDRRVHHPRYEIVATGEVWDGADGSWRGLPPTGRKVDFELIIVFKFEDDRIVCERRYFNIGTALQQLGVQRDPNKLSGKVELIAAHPLAVGKAVARSLLGRRWGGPGAAAR